MFTVRGSIKSPVINNTKHDAVWPNLRRNLWIKFVCAWIEPKKYKLIIKIGNILRKLKLIMLLKTDQYIGYPKLKKIVILK